MRVCAHTAHSEELAPKGARLATLLGEMRREKNGAVADYMRFYGDKYGLNYGVSLPTIRSIARREATILDAPERYKFAKQLYRQEVRELRLAALWIADAGMVTTPEELGFWARGVVNSEVAEEAAFALLYGVELVDVWLNSDICLLQYCAIMAMAKRLEGQCEKIADLLINGSAKLVQTIENEPHIIPKAAVALLDSAIKSGVDSDIIEQFIRSLDDESLSKRYIDDEIAWRLKFR